MRLLDLLDLDAPFLTPPRSGKRCLEELDKYLLTDAPFAPLEPDCTTLWQFVSGSLDDGWWYDLSDEEKATEIHPYDSNCVEWGQGRAAGGAFGFLENLDVTELQTRALAR